MANTNLVTDFSTSPYYDDFDPKKGYYRILFRPSYAVQSRELTQMQTMIQHQIDSFASHIFKEGSLVEGGSINLDKFLNYVKIRDNDYLNVPVNVDNFVNLRIRGVTSNVHAIVTNVSDGNELSANTKTLHVKYISAGGANNDLKTFLVGERLESVNTSTVFTANIISSNTALGYGSSLTVEEGTIFAKDHFIYFPRQSVILDRYNRFPNCYVGFIVHESIITPEQDFTLNDPAQGSYNYAAPGAHRLKLDAELVSLPLSANTGNNFVMLYEIKNGEVQQKNDKPQYAEIKDEWARRTYDESGHYVVRGLGIRLREHLDTGTNLGWKTLADGGNTYMLAVGVEPGKAYVQGYEYENLVTRYVEIDKGIDYEHVEQLSIGANYGAYVDVEEVCGTWNVNEGSVVSLRDAAQTKISNGQYSTTGAAGAEIGTAKFRAIEYVSGTQGSSDAKYRIYLYDIKMTSGEFAEVKGLYISNGSPKANAFADIVLDNNGEAILKDTNFNRAIFKIPASNIRSIRDDTNNVDTTFPFLRTFDVTISTAGTFSISTGLTDEVFPFSTGLLSSGQKNGNFVVTLNESATVPLSGTITVSSGSSSVTGVGTSFLSQLRAGDKIRVDATSEVYTIDSITNNTLLTLTSNVSTAAAGSNFFKQYYAGEIIDLTVNGSGGSVREVNVTSTTTAAFDLKETLTATASASVSCRLNKVDAREIKKVLYRNRYVKINCGTSGTTGPFNLGISDVLRIVEVRRKNGDFSSPTEGVDVTSQFILDNGQRDNTYEHAQLIKVGGSLSASDYLLVKLDYFDHDFSQGVGYFSVDSYPIDDTGADPVNNITTQEIPIYVSPVTGRAYNLRDSIDCRPVKANTAANAPTVGAATVSPATTESFKGISSGLHTPIPNSTIIADLSYYLKRKDVIVVNSKGNISAVRGVPSLFPVTPKVQEDAMAIATIDVAPYPSLPPQVAKSANRTMYGCSITATAPNRFTMRDIGTLKQRIENLEYYTSLTLLEKSALDMKILDANGLDRFKNGIFVDPFKSHKVADIANVDYSIAVDMQKNELRPRFTLGHNRLKLQSSTNLTKTGNILTLPYSEVEFINQPFATNTRNAAGVYYKFKGIMELSPDGDTWTDTQTLPDLQITDDADYQAWATFADAWGIHWNDWQTIWSGSTTSSTLERQSSSDVISTFENTTTTTTTVQQRTGTQLIVNPITKTENYGERVVDTTLVPYIRSQTIQFVVSGVKGTARHYMFFDGENVSSYVTQTNSSFEPIKNEGDPIISDENGVIYGLLRIPNDDNMKFRVGTKPVLITDSFTNSDDATSTAQTNFTAFGLTQYKQNTIVSTTVPVISTSTTQETRTLTDTTFSRTLVSQTFMSSNVFDNSSVNSSNGSGGDPIAQSFFIDLIGQVSGCFVTKIDLFFKEKDPNFGVMVEIREIDQVTSMITPKVIPGSRIKLKSADINVSEDGSVPTTFTFKNPIFLMNQVEYAFVVIPEANNPNTIVWTSRLGEIDIATGVRVNEQPYAGVMFLSSNQRQWNVLQEEDIKFKIYRADFNTNVVGTCVFTNDDTEYLNVNTASGTFSIAGEKVHGEIRLSLSNISGGVIANNMVIVGNTSGASGIVTNITGSTYRVKDVPTSVKYITSEPVVVNYANGAPTPITAVLTGQSTPTAKVVSYHARTSQDIQLELTDSTGDFVVGEQIIGQTSNTSAIIQSINDKGVSVIDFEPCEINFVETSTSWEARSTSTANVLDSAWQKINPNENNVFKVEKRILSRTNEVNNMGGLKSLQFRGRASTGSNYVSPIIDAGKTYNIYVFNIVNNDATGEDAANGGNALARYISQKVTLAEGQDAEDLKVYLTCYKPPGTSVKVYYKILNGEDSDTFNTAVWTEMELASRDVFSDSENTEDFREFEWKIPDANLTGPNGEVQYSNSNGVTFTGFKYFAIKIVLLSANSAVVPRAKELRAIALQI